MNGCKHENFNCIANVGRLVKGEDLTVTPSAFVAEITIHCRDCGEPFEFLGVPMGYQPGATRCSPNGLELRAALKPKNETLDQTGMPGFDINLRMGQGT